MRSLGFGSVAFMGLTVRSSYEHRDWGWRFTRLHPQYTSWDNLKDPDRPIIIGYISPDFFTHSVSYFIEAPLTHHDYTKYKVVVYSAVVKVWFFLKKLLRI